MAKKLYVGNLPYSIDDNKLRALFEGKGVTTVTSATIIMDRSSGYSKGFGFVEISDDAEAEKAINEMNGEKVEDRALTVNEARPLEPRAPGGPRRDGGNFDRRGGSDRDNRRW